MGQNGQRPQDMSAVTDAEKATARRFADCCYDDSLRMPSRAAMQRLVDLGIVERLAPGCYAETPRLRQLGY